jgi:hypothetical protein
MLFVSKKKDVDQLLQLVSNGGKMKKIVLIDGHQFLGSVINSKTIYIDNNQIIIK